MGQSVSRQKMAPVLAYWSIRGLAQPIRLLLEYTGTEFENKLYECGPAPTYDKSCWFDVKFSLGLDFPNLPYYIDGDVKLTQSTAILRHIGNKHNLCGTTEKEIDRINVVENQISDFKNGFVRLCYNPEFENLKGKYLENLPGAIKLFSQFLGDNKWLAGENISFADFMLYEMLDQHLLLEPACLKDTPNLEEYHKRFQEIPEIKKYM